MKKIQSLKGILGLLSVIVVLFLIAIFMLFQNIKNQMEDASNLQNKIDVATRQNQYTISLQKSLQNSKADIDKVNSSILSSDGNVSFIEKFETLAKNNGLNVSIDSLSVEDIPNINSDNLTSLVVRASAEGSWTGTIVFLTSLESFPFAMRVEKFDLLNSSDNPVGLPPPTSFKQNWLSTFEIRVLEYKQN
jgi:mannitol-specific phosphotransferase system IIBC component